MLILGSSTIRFYLQGLIVYPALVSLAVGQDDDPVRDRCARWHHSAMIRHNSIFIDGGVQLFQSNQTKWLGFSEYIYEFDISSSWDANTNFSESRIGRYANSSTNTNPPNMVRGALYAAQKESNRLFTFGGSTFLANDSDPDWEAPSQDPTSLWSYDTEVRVWDSYNITDAVPWRPNWGAYAEDTVNDVGFFLNGQYDRGSSYGLYTSVEYEGGNATNASYAEISYLGGLIMIDLHSQETKNISTASLGKPRVAGALLHSSAFGKSKNGTLITFGGMQSSGQGEDTFTNGDLIDLSVVSLCDSFKDENVTWFNQTTTGDIPSPRIDFCTLPYLKRPTDNSSYNIYIHGGYNPSNSTLYDEAYVLSLPSFTWTKVYSGTEGRFGHTCNSAGNRQMLVTGGARDASLWGVETTGDVPDLNSTTCDDGLGVSLFDLTNLTWGTFFNRSAPAYQVPATVVDVIGGSGDGGATMTSPAAGFAHPAIWTMFHPPATPTSTASSSSSGGTSGGAIAGAVVGSLAGAGLVLGGVWFVLRRRRTRASRLQRQATDASTVQELPSHSAEILEKPAVGEAPTAINEAPQELDAAGTEWRELPADVGKVGEKDGKLEEGVVEGRRTPQELEGEEVRR